MKGINTLTPSVSMENCIPDRSSLQNSSDSLSIHYSKLTSDHIHIQRKEKFPCLLGKMFESRFPHASGREEG
jgi:hypothetical protein